MEDGKLCYFAVQGEMHPDIVERCIRLSDYNVTTRTARQIVDERPPRAPELCIAQSECGCWNGCVRARLIRHAGRAAAAYQVVDSEVVLERVQECLDGACFEVCRGTGGGEPCEAGTYQAPSNECEESCPPSRADFHCETLENECRTIQHSDPAR